MLNFFSRPKFDYQKLILSYSHTLTKPTTDLNRFAKIAPYIVTKAMKLSGGGMLVLDRAKLTYDLRAGYGEAETLASSPLSQDNPLVAELLKREKIMVKNEASSPAVREELSKLKAEVVIPSVSRGEYFKVPTLISIIFLGRKNDGRGFTAEDLGFLEIMANQAAINIEYSFIMEELKRNQEQIIKSEKLAAIGTTVAGIAHELKNPLTYLLTVAQSMGQSWNNESFKESVIKMFPSEVERMKLIIDGLSDYSKMQALRFEPVEVTTVLNKVIAILGYEIKKNNVYVVTNYPPAGEKAVAKADNNRLVQVFMNIIANAVQALGPKGGDLKVVVRAEQNKIIVAITDTGPGMDKETIQKIFDPFFTTKEAGTGLGLSITKKIVDEHQGKLLVESIPGKGTTFTVSLPTT